MSNMQVSLGCMAPTLKEQGFDDDKGHLEKDREAIQRLSIRGYLTRSTRVSAEKKLVKKLRPLHVKGECDE